MESMIKIHNELIKKTLFLFIIVKIEIMAIVLKIMQKTINY